MPYSDYAISEGLIELVKEGEKIAEADKQLNASLLEGSRSLLGVTPRYEIQLQICWVGRVHLKCLTDSTK